MVHIDVLSMRYERGTIEKKKKNGLVWIKVREIGTINVAVVSTIL